MKASIKKAVSIVAMVGVVASIIGGMMASSAGAVPKNPAPRKAASPAAEMSLAALRNGSFANRYNKTFYIEAGEIVYESAGADTYRFDVTVMTRGPVTGVELVQCCPSFVALHKVATMSDGTTLWGASGYARSYQVPEAFGGTLGGPSTSSTVAATDGSRYVTGWIAGRLAS